MKPRIARYLGILNILVALSAFAGGAAFIAAPDGSIMHAPLERLEGSPFNDFLVPGLVLAIGVGGMLLAAGIALLREWRWAAALSFASGAVIGGWIVIQVAIINELGWLHFLYGSLAIVVMALSLLLWTSGRHGQQQRLPGMRRRLV